MAIKDMISPGVGFTPVSVEYIVTRGLDAGAAAALAQPVLGGLFRMGLQRLGPGLAFIVGALRGARRQPSFTWSFAT